MQRRKRGRLVFIGSRLPRPEPRLKRLPNEPPEDGSGPVRLNRVAQARSNISNGVYDDRAVIDMTVTRVVADLNVPP